MEAKATLIDQALDLHDRMIGGLFNRAKRRHAEEFQQSGEANARESSSLFGASVKLCDKPDKVGSILFPLSKRSSHGSVCPKRHRGPMARARVSGKQRRIEIDVPFCPPSLQ